MSTEIMYEVLPDIPRFYTALAEWLACLICISKLKKEEGIGILQYYRQVYCSAVRIFSADR